jgi:peptidoglycan/xylan/chitin deacetylase (PgdA/CDA1 family)
LLGVRVSRRIKRGTLGRFGRAILMVALLLIAIVAVAGCERVVASSRTAAEHLSDSYIDAYDSMATDSPTPVLDDNSAEPAADSDADTATVVPLDYPTTSVPPVWADDFSGVINGVVTDKHLVALTIDDGPTAHTKAIVDQLAQAHMHATFFWVGSRITTEAAQYAVSHGEELANHTWTHPNMRKLSSEEASEQIGYTNARIAQITGQAPIWFRSPFNRLYSRELAQIEAHGLLYANYNITSADWMDVSDADMLGKIEDGLRPGGVILMHDSPKHNPKVLPAVLRLLQHRGYRAVTLTALTHYGPAVREPLTLGAQGLGH